MIPIHMTKFVLEYRKHVSHIRFCDWQENFLNIMNVECGSRYYWWSQPYKTRKRSEIIPECINNKDFVVALFFKINLFCLLLKLSKLNNVAVTM